MKLSMNDSRVSSVSDLLAFVNGTKLVAIEVATISEKYQLVSSTIAKFKYHKLSRKDKHIVRLYLRKLTGYKKAQLNRLIKRAVTGNLTRIIYVRNNPHHSYTTADIKLLEITDVLHRRLNRLATKEILRREAEKFNHPEYAHIAQVSASHIDNLRQSQQYRSFWQNGTKPREVNIGTTKQPETNNRPGSIRVDTVHQRDVYYLNAVCEVTQWEVAVCVPQISERYLLPALKRLLNQFPFKISNFHSDRGSEFINQVVATLLNKLLIEQTKSRSRHSNDNALVESKNGSVIRKNMGYCHIHFEASEIISDFFEQWFNPYLNYHRPCLYATDTTIDQKGRSRVVYGEATTPYEKLKEVDKTLSQTCLKETITFNQLNNFAYKESDNEFTRKMREEETRVFDTITKMKG